MSWETPFPSKHSRGQHCRPGPRHGLHTDGVSSWISFEIHIFCLFHKQRPDNAFLRSSWNNEKYTFASSPVERIWSAWKGLNNRQRVKSFPNTYGGKMVINCEHQHSALDFSFRRLTAHYGEMQPWKLDRIRLRIITLNIAYLWHFFSDQNSLGSTFWSLTRFWWVLSWIMVLTEDLLSLRLACVILYLWDFLRLGKKVKYNQRLVVKFKLQEGVSCSNTITIIIFTSGSYLTFPNWKSINGFYTILSVCIFGYVWINILSQWSRPTIFGSQILPSCDQRCWYSWTFSFSSAWVHKRRSASSNFHQAWKIIIFFKWWKV